MTQPAGDAKSWNEGEKFLASKGFTEHYDIGYAGAGGYGTKHFFKKPGVEPQAEYATLSWDGARWQLTVFEGAKPKRATLTIVGGKDYE